MLSYSLIVTSLRRKFFFFALIIITFSFWGFLFDLDGIMLIFLVTEFTIILLFLMTYLQLYSNFNFLTSKHSKKFILCFFFIFFVSNTNEHFFYYTSYYKSLQHIVSSDFFILYYILFINTSILVVLTTIILSFFSLFFILLYFNFKLIKNAAVTKQNTIYFLRKQNLLKQTSFTNLIYSFQS